MTWIEALLLGIIQALTEFLPVSSSGHLRIAHAVFGAAEHGDLLFDVLLHGGTLVAVFYVYADRIGGLLRDLLPSSEESETPLLRREPVRLVILLMVATIPTGVIGVAAEDMISSDIISISVVGGLLIANGFILLGSRYVPSERSMKERGEGPQLQYAGITVWSAFLIGVVQGVAVLPGISRAGITIVVALLLGANREKSAEFSFFLSIPAIMGAIVLKLSDSAGGGQQADMLFVYVVGAVSAAVAGVFALQSLLRVLRQAKMHRFSWYCWALGLFAIVWNQAL